jgi:ribosomal protein S18 acetylase RimI-like enzyme
LAEIDQETWSPLVTPQVRELAGIRFAQGRFEPDEVIVAEVDGRIAGYVHIGESTPLESNRHVLHVHGLAVAPEDQGAGVGRRLMSAAIDQARRRGARRLTLRVFGVNERAQALYAALGFVVEGVLREEFFVDGRFVDDVQMALRL